MKQLERKEQRELVSLCTQFSVYNPLYGLIFAIPNGGKRDFIEAVQLKLSGVKSGVPDLMFPVARCGYHGLFIEMKYGKGKESGKQVFWITELKEQGYKVETCFSANEAFKVIEKYIKNEDYIPIAPQKVKAQKLPF